MKIRITKPLEANKLVRPEVGSVHEVVSFQPARSAGRGLMVPQIYFIKIGLAQVGVRPSECEIVEEGGT